MELLERERFFEELARRLRSATAAHGSTAVISGEAGIGKTALIEQFAAVHQATCRVLWGACEHLFTPLPLGPLHDIALQADSGLRELIERGASRPTIFAAVLDFLLHAARPTILVFEDIHWADEATLDLIKFLSRRVQRAPALLVLSYREEEVGMEHPLRFVLGDLPGNSTLRIELPPLSEDAVALLARRAHRPVDNLYRATAGNPFFLTEVLVSEDTAVPASIRDAVLARTARLSPAAREVLEFVAIVPGRSEHWLLTNVLDPGAEAIDECVNTGLLRQDNLSIGFRHELARQTIEAALPPAQLQLLHQRLLHILLERGSIIGHLGRIVHHATRAGDWALVLRYAPAAARRAASFGAHREAVAHYAAAVGCADALPPAERVELLEAYSYECYLVGDFAAAGQSRATALELCRQLDKPLRVGDDLRWMSRISWALGRREDAERYAVESIAVLESLEPGPELAMAYSNRSQLHMLALEKEEAVFWGRKAVELATRCNDHQTLVHALNNLGATRLFSADDGGQADLETSLRFALEYGFEEHAGRAYTNLASTLLQRRAFAAADAVISEGLTYCTEHDIDYLRFYLDALRAQVALERGELEQAAENASAALDNLRACRGVGMPTLIHALTTLALARMRLGAEDAAELLEEAHTLAHRMGELRHVMPIAAARAEAAWLSGNRRRCRAEAHAAFDLALRRAEPWMLGELSLWLWRGGGLDAAPAHIARPYALQIGGDWQAAAEAWQSFGCRYEQALALADGDEPARRTALAILEELGARPAAELLRRRLREAGARQVPRGPRRRTRNNPAGLTDRQFEVLRLMAEGLSNAEIATRLSTAVKTVDHHVSAVLTKLEVRSRAEAVSLAHTLGILEP
jgi:DNA-binding CsgD family transcriptional regulator